MNSHSAERAPVLKSCPGPLDTAAPVCFTRGMRIGEYDGGLADDIGQNQPPATDHLLPTDRESEPTPWYLDRLVQRRRVKGNTLPNTLPLTAEQLRAAGVTRASLRKHYHRIEYGHYIPVDQLLPETTDSGFARARRVHPATLIRAHNKACPGHLVTGFGAAAMSGMEYFASEEALEFLVARGDRVGHHPPHLLLTRTRKLEALRADAVTPDASSPGLLATSHGFTLGRMLDTLDRVDEARNERWRVPDLSSVRPHLAPEFIRQVQVSDAFHQGLGKGAVGSLEKLVRTRTVRPDRAAAVLGATDVGAESPPETLLRLVVADLAPGLCTQLPVFRDNGRLLTSADMGWEEHGVYLFYDGLHHQQQTQRDHDSKVRATLQSHGGRVFRVTAGQLKTVEEVVALRELVAEALGI